MRGDAVGLGPGIFKCWYHYPELADSHILLNLLRAGYSICKICEMLECTRTNVASAKKNHGNPAVLRRTRTRRNAKKNEEVKQPRRTKKDTAEIPACTYFYLTVSVRSNASFSRSIDAAYEMRIQPGAPNAVPGVAATCALSSHRFAVAASSPPTLMNA